MQSFGEDSSLQRQNCRWYQLCRPLYGPVPCLPVLIDTLLIWAGRLSGSVSVSGCLEFRSRLLRAGAADRLRHPVYRRSRDQRIRDGVIGAFTKQYRYPGNFDRLTAPVHDLFHAKAVPGVCADLGLASLVLPFPLKCIRELHGFRVWALFYPLAGCSCIVSGGRRDHCPYRKACLPAVSGFGTINAILHIKLSNRKNIFAILFK